MKQATFSSYRGRLALLAIGAVVLIGLFWRNKLGPTLEQWNAHRTWRSEAIPVDQLKSEHAAFTSKLQALDGQLASGTDASAGWKPVLDLLGEQDITGVSLSGISEEHVSEAEGAVVRTLPLSLQGGTADLVNTIDALERKAKGVHLLTVDLDAKASSYDAPRKLVATLYLQTLSR